MKYLCLVYEKEETLNGLSRDEWAALRRETLGFLDDLAAQGRLVGAEALQSARNAVTLRVRSRKLTVLDGPFAETKEQIGGYFLIEAKDLNEAIQIASRWPGARLGTLEIRPVEPVLRDDGRYLPLRPPGEGV